ncbi:LysR family transcriptional regulator [Actibacterium lipolyticum]|uniref:DNA-binding transcriptional activator GcvA n=1 Tax=Actibacterium lipolyticum TaxID=1524263 RepID=A0A238JX27_9RHOB|nr:LysR family transcriptional regulator [Actibacterium lipolyticum]SMX35200.1 DNA-binding transcriptional activator GcvA [Actibacterium lipolyticum]
MKQTPSLDSYALFIAVADSGGLAGAARATGVSVPTLSRKMADLESILGQHLFARGPRGYALTAAGRALLDEAEGLRDIASRLTAFSQSDKPMQVRVTAGQWTSQFLARHITKIWSPDAEWVPAFIASNARVDIARREADIGIRNKRPDQSWLAGRKTMTIDYAAFALSPDATGYITLTESTATTPSERWLRQNHSDEIITTANNARLALDLALAGVGRVILPTFASSTYPALQQVGPPIKEIRHEEWLVCHHDARHDPPIRQALDAFHTLLSDRSLRPEAAL